MTRQSKNMRRRRVRAKLAKQKLAESWKKWNTASLSGDWKEYNESRQIIQRRTAARG